MRPGDRIDRWTLGPEQKGTPELQEWLAEPDAELVSPRPHVRLRPGMVEQFVSFQAPEHPAVLPELFRGRINGEPVCVRPRSRPLAPGRAGLVDEIGDLLDRYPDLTEADLREDAEGRVRVALPGLPSHPSVGREPARARITRWNQPPTAAPLVPLSGARFGVVVPLHGLDAEALLVVAHHAAADPEQVRQAARRRGRWAVGAATTLAEARRLQERLARRGVTARVDGLDVPTPRFWPAMVWTGIAQAGFLLDGMAEQLVVFGLTAVGVGTLVRAIRGLAPWLRSREAVQAVTEARQAMVAGPARRIVVLLERTAELPSPAREDAREALQLAQDHLDEVDPAALDAVEAAWGRDDLARALRRLRR